MIIKTSYPFMKPPPSARLIRGHRLSQGLAAYWLFNEGSGNIVFDSSGNRGIGTITGATWVPGKFGSAIAFAENQYIDIPNNSLTQWTWISWIYGISPVSGWFIVIGETGSDKNYIGRKADGKFRVFHGTTNATLTTDAPVLNTWEQWAVAYDGTDYYFYINGQYKGTVNFAGETFNFFQIGSVYTGAFDFVGNMDNNSIYNRALSASEIAELYWKPFYMFERKARTALMSGYEVVAPPVGMAGAMTTNSGYWGW